MISDQEQNKEQQDAEDMAEEMEAAAEEEMAEESGSDYEAEIADLKDRLLRAVAETENVRRRAEKERGDASTYAITGFARDVLSISDNLSRALSALPDGARDNEDMAGLIAGIEMTERELLNTLEKHGIRKIEPKGEKFDHNFHQAMFEVESAEHKPGTVVEVVQAGYVIKDRLLRPAMVGVAKASQDSAEGVDKVV